MSDHRIPPKPKYFDTVPPGTCRWCNKKIGPTPKGNPSRSRWHPKCVKEYKLIHWPSETRKAVWRRDKGVCAKCGKQCSRKGNSWHMDHIVPLVESKGKLKYWKLGNLQTLCVDCHKQKTINEATQRAARRRSNKK